MHGAQCLGTGLLTGQVWGHFCFMEISGASGEMALHVGRPLDRLRCVAAALDLHPSKQHSAKKACQVQTLGMKQDGGPC